MPPDPSSLACTRVAPLARIFASNFWLSMYAFAKPSNFSTKEGTMVDRTAGGVKLDGEKVCREY